MAIAEDIKEKMKKPNPCLFVGRLPRDTFDKFKELSEKEFCSDHGFLLKHLLDFYLGMIPTGTEHLELEIDALKEDMQKLKESLKETKQDSGIKMMSGKLIKRK